MSDLALCGDSTCQSPACRQSAINAWEARQEADAKAIVQDIVDTDSQTETS